MRKITFFSRPSERGSTLIVTLILLLILTIMAVGEIQFNSIQTRIASNSADELVAFQTAEGVLNQGINFVLAGNYTPSSFIANAYGLYLYVPGNTPLWTSINWSSSSAVVQSYQGNSKTRGAYIIEQLPSVTQPGQSMSKPTMIFRVTARAVGASGGAIVILQSTVQVPQ